jgi:hypothetical protein
MRAFSTNSALRFNFPWYFGENGNAFRECIYDLSWLSPQVGYVLLITEPAKVLSSTDDDGLSWLIRVLDGASGNWARPVQAGQSWDRSPVPFHVVLQAAASDFSEAITAWTVAGASISPIYEPGVPAGDG